MELLTLLESVLLLTLQLCSFTYHIKKTIALLLFFVLTEIQLPSVTIICHSSMSEPRAEDCPLIKPNQGLEVFFFFFVSHGYFAKK